MQRVLQFMQKPWILSLSLFLALGLWSMSTWGPWATVREHLAPAELKIYGDWEEKPAGHSQGSVQKNDSAWILNYELAPGFVHPYVGMSLRFGQEESQDPCLDLSGIDSLVFDLQGLKAFGLTVQMIAPLPAKTGTEPFRILQASLPVSAQRQTVSIASSDLVIPDWWRQSHHLPLVGSLPRYMDRICRIELIGGGYVPVKQLDQVQLYGLWAQKPNLWGRFLGVFWLFVTVLLWILKSVIYRQKKKLEQEKALLIHRPLELNMALGAGGDWERLQKLLLEEYENPDCNLELLSQRLGLSKRKVGELIKEHTGLGFKEYLNGIRIKEACAQLSNPKLQIQTIAFAVGFGNISHFNRVFKEVMGSSPKEWKKSQEESGNSGPSGTKGSENS